MRAENRRGAAAAASPTADAMSNRSPRNKDIAAATAAAAAQRRGAARDAHPQSRPRVLPSLTGLRFVAAVLVVMFHFLNVPLAVGSGAGHAASVVFSHIVKSGFTGVSFFFVLSGFILTYSYLEPGGRLRGSRSRFYWARVARIYPIYIVALLLDLAPYLGWGTATPPVYEHPRFVPMITLSPLLLQAWLPYPPNWNPPTWSLSAEAFFYVLFPLLVPLVGRLCRRRLPSAALAFWGISAMILLVYVVVDPDRGQSGPWYDHHWLRILYDNPLSRLPEFFLGAAAARIFVTRYTAGADLRRPRWLRPAWLSVAAAIGIVAVWSLGPLHVALANQLILDPLFALLIYSLAYGEGPLAAVFGTPVAVVLGEASYALYLLQWPVHDWLWHLVFPQSTIQSVVAPNAQGWVYFAIFLGVAIVAALLAYRFVEKPARHAIRSVTDAWSRRGAAAEAPTESVRGDQVEKVG